MTIKSLQEILREILKEGRKSEGEWKTITAPTSDRTGSDLLLFHPISGPVYQIRAYEKNPYQMEGMGTRISRSIDSDFLTMINNQKSRGSTGILDINFRILQRSMEEGAKLDKVFLDALFGDKKHGIDFLNLGASFNTKNKKPIPSTTENQKKLDKEYEKLMKREGKSNMYG